MLVWRCTLLAMRSRLKGALLATAAAILGACSDSTASTSTSHVNSPAAPSNAPVSADFAAEIIGRVAFNAAELCYFLATKDGAAQATVWPDGVTQMADGSGLRTKERWIPVGSQVTGGGGEFSSNPTPPGHRRPSCPVHSYGAVTVFNGDANINVVPTTSGS
jgi:hypothetical protein